MTHIKNLTEEGVTEGFFMVLINGRLGKLACEVCFKLDAENPTFLRGAFTDETCTFITITCPKCGTEQKNMPTEGCPTSFMIQPEAQEAKT